MQENLPHVSVIVINARGTRQLEKCLKFLVQTAYPKYEIIIVDCLTNNLQKWIKKFNSNIKVIHYSKDIGPAASHNVKNQYLDPQSKYLAFLDNDAYVTENWLTELVKVMGADKKIGVAQSKIVLAKHPKILDHAGLAIDTLGTWYTPRGLEASKFKDVFEIFASSSAASIVRREAFAEAGGFDADYLIYDDDTDFSFRIRLLGYKIVYVPSAIVFHEGETARTISPRRLYHGSKNRACTMLKNFELKNLWWRFLLYMTLTFFTGCGLALMKKKDEAKAVFQSMIYPILNIKDIWIKRIQIQSKRRIRDSELLHKGFIRNDIRPTFSDAMLKLVYFKE